MLLKNGTIEKLFKILLDCLPPPIVRDILLIFLDVIEEAIEASENEIDDKFIQPLITLLRNVIE